MLIKKHGQNYYRTNYTSLTAFCGFNNLGCICNNNTGTIPNCDGRINESTSFLTVTAVQQVCVWACSCMSANAYSKNVPANHDFNIDPNPGCPNATDTTFPIGKTINDYREQYLEAPANLSCVKSVEEAMSPLWTLVQQGFDMSKAQKCQPCPGGYRDPDCKWQPLPLPICGNSPNATVAASELSNGVSTTANTTGGLNGTAILILSSNTNGDPLSGLGVATTSSGTINSTASPGSGGIPSTSFVATISSNASAGTSSSTYAKPLPTIGFNSSTSISSTPKIVSQASATVQGVLLEGVSPISLTDQNSNSSIGSSTNSSVGFTLKMTSSSRSTTKLQPTVTMWVTETLYPSSSSSAIVEVS